jgi:hypothetical protein
MFSWIDVTKKIESSYKKNDIGWLFYALVKMHKPTKCVEIGALYGYSAIFIAAALRSNNQGHLQVYDVWHTPQGKTWDNIYEAGVHNWVSLNHLEAKCVPAVENFPIDFIHIDIGNGGEDYRWALDSFAPLTPPGAIMLLEGGSDACNWVEWMDREGKEPIMVDDLRYHEVYHYNNWDLFVFDPFPGVTVAKRLKYGGLKSLNRPSSHKKSMGD